MDRETDIDTEKIKKYDTQRDRYALRGEKERERDSQKDGKREREIQLLWK